MMLVLSGEGPTDLGCCRMPVDACDGDEFSAGPLAVIVDQLLSLQLGYRPIEVHPQSVHFVSKARLTQLARDGRRRRGVSFRGPKRHVETGYFYIAAWMLGQVALELEIAHADIGIAVLHRDSDDRSSQSHALWEDKFTSMRDGFGRAGYPRGVPMLPRPISEAWLLCLARPGIADCSQLEQESASDRSPSPLKQQLDVALGEHMGAQALADWVEGRCDADKLDSIPSFAQFRRVLNQALASVLA